MSKLSPLLPAIPPLLPAIRSLLAAIAVLGLAACGDDEREEFASRAEALCAREGAALGPVARTMPRSPEQTAARIRDTVSVERRTLRELSELRPPEDLRASFDDYLEKREEALAVLRARRRALEHGDRETYDVAVAKEIALVEEARAIAHELDLDACAAPAGLIEPRPA